MFKQGDQVILINKLTGSRSIEKVERVAPQTGRITLENGDRFRQDGTATNNLDRECIEVMSEPCSGDLVEITAIGKIESVTESGYMVRVHGEVVPMLKEQVRLIPDGGRLL